MRVSLRRGNNFAAIDPSGLTERSNGHSHLEIVTLIEEGREELIQICEPYFPDTILLRGARTGDSCYRLGKDAV